MGKLIEKEGRFYKKCGVVMLDNNNPYKVKQLIIWHDGVLRTAPWSDSEGKLLDIHKPQHLYITSDDEIKEGDWIYHPLDVKPIQFYSTVDLIDPSSYGYKKIIATTDSSLGTLEECPVRGAGSSVKYILPQFSDKFIQAYIEAYNKGEKIEKVLVEYDEYDGTTSISRDWGGKLKLKDNNIIIKKVKDSWTREEVEVSHLQMAVDITKHILCGGSFTTFDVSEWINENI